MPKIMWQPSAAEIDRSNMMHFLASVNKKYQLSLSNYSELFHWSIENTAFFWQSIWEFFRIKASKPAEQIFVPGQTMHESKWFIGAKLNFAENLLSRQDDHIALIFNNEKNQRKVVTYSQLYESVAKLAAFFKKNGVKQNDRIAAVLPNMPEAIIAMLATTSLGAIWSSCSPDFGKESLYDRFHQIAPRILIICDGYYYNGKHFSNQEKIAWLQEKLPSSEKIVLVNYTDHPIATPCDNFDDIMKAPKTELTFQQLPFAHPVYIMYSSGTTGIPKCIVHGAGGTLLQHLKELALHTNVGSSDRVFYYTTCGWMMWNWYVSSLALGATLIQYDGAPFHPSPARLIDLIDQEKMTIFGTSAKYISAIEKNNLHPQQTHRLSSLKTILSTGSPLVTHNYDYVYNSVKKDLCLSSISGGTDIISCFALGNPILPVYNGELQCIGLGMDVKVYDEQGNSVINQKGELVCTSAFPSQPLYFWNDVKGDKYDQAYFTSYPNVWTHGDFAEITDRETVVIYGRSDATLNPGGVRIGTAEIYRQVEKIPEIVDSLATSQEWGDDCRILLFIVLKTPFTLDQELERKIKAIIRENCSPRHVPAKIIAVPDLPRTLSGKTVELAVREMIHQRPVKNISAIANPESLEYFRGLPLDD